MEPSEMMLAVIGEDEVIGSSQVDDRNSCPM